MIRMLLVDDEPVMLIVTKTFLEKDHADIECDTCSSAREALEKLAASSYDAIVSDYDMSEMDGIALLKAVRRADPDLPFILLTGRGREDVVIEALNEGADFYLQKSEEPRVLYAELASKIRYAVDRRRTKEALGESEEQFRRAIEDAPIPIIMQAEDGEVLQISRTWTDLTGYTLQDVPTFAAWLTHAYGEGADDVRGHMQALFKGDQRSIGIEFPIRTRDGQTRHWSFSASSPGTLADGRRFIVGMAVDITERRRAEEILLKGGDELECRVQEGTAKIQQANRNLKTEIEGRERAEEAALKVEGRMADMESANIQFQINIEEQKQANVEQERLLSRLQVQAQQIEAVFSTIVEAVVVYDVEGRPIRANAGATRIFGFDPLGNYPGVESGRQSLRHQDGRLVTREELPIIRALTGQTIRGERYLYTNGEGREFIVDASVAPIYEGGMLHGAVGIWHDATQREQTNQVLRESEEKYRRFFEQDLTADVVSAADGRIIDCNPAFLEVFGFNSTEEALNTNIIETYPSPEDRQQFLELIKREGRVYNYSRTRKRRDGSLIYVVENVVGRFDENGELIELMSFLYDDSERKRAEDALKDASRKLNLLTSITRHDILNQITALKAFLVLLEEPQHDEREAKEMFRNLEKISDTIRRQITFTGDYQEMGERDPEWQQVEWAVKRAAESVRLNGASLAVDTGPLELFADPMLEKVFYNLLDNAFFHGERVEHITVSFQEDGDTGVLVFEDDGVGVPASSKDMIFERGFGKVPGYGLFLVKEILDITGLSIRETGEEGKGARFEIEVPTGKWRM